MPVGEVNAFWVMAKMAGAAIRVVKVMSDTWTTGFGIEKPFLVVVESTMIMCLYYIR